MSPRHLPGGAAPALVQAIATIVLALVEGVWDPVTLTLACTTLATVVVSWARAIRRRERRASRADAPLRARGGAPPARPGQVRPESGRAEEDREDLDRVLED